ncbi:MAG: hypothetical protein KDA05_01210 [Phycisphaerales bacterium]|nr:hypothetical protein [Phycisphaerales bacterium]
MPRRPQPAACRLLAASVLVLLLGACSSRPTLLEPLTSTPGPRLSASDFRQPDAPAAVGPFVQTPGVPVSVPPPITDPVGVSPTAPSNSAAAAQSGNRTPAGPNDPAPGTVVVDPNPPNLTGSAPAPVGRPMLIDVKVGDINGRPVFANEFLAPMEARLRALSLELPRAAWTREARESIQGALITTLQSELLAAEALESIPPAAREVGLTRVLNATRQRTLARAGGSITEAQRRLLEERNQTLEQFLREQQEAQLVGLSRENLIRGIQVSGRDIENYYLRNSDTFNPPPSARFRRIDAVAAQAQTVANITEALARGTPFEEVAASNLNAPNRRANAGLVVVPFAGEYAQGEFFNNAELNDAARRLRPGEWAGPITYFNGQLVTWLRLERVTDDSRTLYEAQIQISDTLRQQELVQRAEELIARLRERASFTSETEMIDRLLAIATQRYYPPEQAEPNPGAGVPGPR